MTMQFRLLLLFSIFPWFYCSAMDVDAVKTEFRRLEYEWVQALEKHDVKILDRLLADDFIDSTFQGNVRDKKAILAGSRATSAYHSKGFDDFDVRLYGADTAIVTAVNLLEGRTQDDVVRVRFTDVFIKQGGRWRAVSAQETVQNRLTAK